MDVLDKLKTIGYQKDFCSDVGFRPINSHFYFTMPAPNPNEQFFYFTSLFTWLLHKLGVNFEIPGQFDDPNATAANLANELKKMGIPFEFGPHKLKQGHGDAVLYALQALADKVLAQSGFAFQKPVHKVDDYPEEAEVDADAEITLDNVEERLVADDDDDEIYVDRTKTGKAETKVAILIKPTADPADWKLEVERVGPMLRVQIQNDNKDWRVHIDQMALHQKVIDGSLVETKGQLHKLQLEIEKTLEKISSRERYINTQFEGQIEEQRALQDQLSELRQKYNVSNSNVSELSNELTRISEELDSVKSRMDDIGNGMTDSKPLVNIKQGVARLKSDIKQMDLRIGVIEHTLLQAKLKVKQIIPSF